MASGGGARCLVCIALALSASSSGAQSYTETERVTVIDLPVEFRAGRVVKDLSPDEVVVLLDGESKPIVGFDSMTVTDLQPHQVLIYLDSEMADRHHLQASTDLLLEAKKDLMSLGTVDIVVADPDPRFVLRDSSDADRVEGALVGGAWRRTSGDGIRALRSSFLKAIADLESESEVNELASAFIGEETRLIQQRLDRLVSFLAESGSPGKLRILLLVGFRFDWDPATFYRAWTAAEEDTRPASRGTHWDLRSHVQETAKTVTAYGWVTLPVAPPEPSGPLVPGFRIGKWRLVGPAGGRIIGVKLTRESERDPELAEGHLENGEALLADGKPLEARAAFDKALHYFYGDPKTAELQARALVGLAAAQEALGDNDRARNLKVMAADVDASVVDELGEPLSTLLDPRAPLEVLALESSGLVLSEADEIRSTLGDLAQRTRVSIQLEGEPSGEILPVELRWTRPDHAVANPRWARFGTPESVATARVRLLMAGKLLEASYDLEGRLARNQEQDEFAQLEVRLEGPNEVPRLQLGTEKGCRLTLGTGSAEEGTLLIEHRRVTCDYSQGGMTATESIAGDIEFAALLLEHLASGAWGVTVVEREDPS